MGEESRFLSQTFQILVPPLSSDVTLDKSQFPHMQNDKIRPPLRVVMRLREDIGNNQ